MKVQTMDDILNDTLEKLGYPKTEENLTSFRIIYKCKQTKKLNAYVIRDIKHLITLTTGKTPFSQFLSWLDENENNCFIEFLGSEKRIITSISVNVSDFLYNLNISINFKTFDKFTNP